MAKMEVYTRNVDKVPSILWYGYPQHTYLIKTNDDGTREVLRGGLDTSNNELLIIKQNYEWDGENDDDKPIDWDENGTNLGRLLIESTQEEIDTKWTEMWGEGENINDEHNVYKVLGKNCNYSLERMTSVVGLDDEVESFINETGLWTPSYGGYIETLEDLTYEELSALTIDPLNNLTKILNNHNQTLLEFFTALASELGTSLEEFKESFTDYINDYLSNLPVGEAISAILSAQLDFLNAQGLSTRWALHDPLVMDLDGDGIELTNIEDSNAYFDIDGDGIAERTGWVKGDDGILVRDVNGNGKIDVFMIKIAC